MLWREWNRSTNALKFVVFGTIEMNDYRSLCLKLNIRSLLEWRELIESRSGQLVDSRVYEMQPGDSTKDVMMAFAKLGTVCDSLCIVFYLFIKFIHISALSVCATRHCSWIAEKRCKSNCVCFTEARSRRSEMFCLFSMCWCFLYIFCSWTWISQCNIACIARCSKVLSWRYQSIFTIVCVFVFFCVEFNDLLIGASSFDSRSYRWFVRVSSTFNNIS